MGNLKKSDVTPMIPIGKAYALYWKQSFCWRGRATRAEYWWPMLINWLVGVGCNQLVSMLEFLSPVIVVVLGLYGLFLVATLFPGLAVYVRRFHDLGHSAWFAFAPQLMLVALVVLAVINYMMSVGFNAGGDEIVAPNLGVVWSTIFVVGGVALMIMGIIWFVFVCLPGQPKSNKYGNPK